MSLIFKVFVSITKVEVLLTDDLHLVYCIDTGVCLQNVILESKPKPELVLQVS